MKSHVLLTIALFLISAPAPDSGDIAEMTSNFIVPENRPGLSASDTGLPDSDEHGESVGDVRDPSPGVLPESGENDLAKPEPYT